MRFIILLTKECKLKCKHCFLGEAKNITFAKSTLKQTFQQFREIGCTYVAITGGEPFLNYDLLEETVRLAGEGEMRCSINTSAYWGQALRMDERLAHLKNLGLTRLKLSTDSYHQEDVPIEVFSKSVALALDADIPVEVTVCYTDIFEQLRTIGYLQDRFGDKIQMFRQQVGNYGRATEEMAVKSGECLSRDQWFCRELKSPVIFPNGDVYTCCGPPISEDLFPHDENPYILGNLFISPLSDLVKKYRETPWIQAIRSLESTCQIKEEEFKNKPCNTICDLCISYAQRMNQMSGPETVK